MPSTATVQRGAAPSIEVELGVSGVQTADLNRRHPYWPLVAGRWYSQIGYITAAAVTLNMLYLVPFWVPEARTFDRIGNYNGANDPAGTFMRLGVYEHDPLTRGPSDLLFDSGQIAYSTAGDRTAVINITRQPGWVWLAAVGQGIAPTLAYVLFYGWHNLGNTIFSAYDVAGYSIPNTSGALPVSASSAALHVTNLVPRIALRAA